MIGADLRQSHYSAAQHTINVYHERELAMSKTPWSRNFAALAISLLLVLALAGCGAQTPAAPAAAAEAPAEAAATEAAATEGAPAEATAEATAEAAAQPAGGALSFQIVPEGSEARFLIDEVLMGQDKTVVGVTSLVSGEITVDPANPTAAQVGEIRVDASDLATDDNRRNGRIRNDILRASQPDYQYIVFQPTAISGLPESVAEGQPFSFQVTGDLTILGVAVPVTFDMNVTPLSASQLTGSGSAVIRWADFGISIPSVPMVAGVDEEVRLEIDFTAEAAL
jgi:polyisoprenoid-binding protein YceI